VCTGARVVTAAAGAVLAVAEAARVCTLTDAVGVGAGAWVDGAVVEAATAVDGAVETCTVAVGVGSAATVALTCAGPAPAETDALGSGESTAKAGAESARAKTAAASVERRRAVRGVMRLRLLCDTSAAVYVPQVGNRNARCL